VGDLVANDTAASVFTTDLTLVTAPATSAVPSGTADIVFTQFSRHPAVNIFA
jgi:hypothetical protein